MNINQRREFTEITIFESDKTNSSVIELDLITIFLNDGKVKFVRKSDGLTSSFDIEGERTFYLNLSVIYTTKDDLNKSIKHQWYTVMIMMGIVIASLVLFYYIINNKVFGN